MLATAYGVYGAALLLLASTADRVVTVVGLLAGPVALVAVAYIQFGKARDAGAEAGAQAGKKAGAQKAAEVVQVNVSELYERAEVAEIAHQSCEQRVDALGRQVRLLISAVHEAVPDIDVERLLALDTDEPWDGDDRRH